MNVEKWMV
jgi:sedoheptulose-bisphosphatase